MSAARISSLGLDTISGVGNLKKDLVISQAEFDVNVAAGSVRAIIQEVAKATGFACQRINTHGHSLNVLDPSNVRDFVKQN